jgi:hypothetical protein
MNFAAPSAASSVVVKESTRFPAEWLLVSGRLLGCRPRNGGHLDISRVLLHADVRCGDGCQPDGAGGCDDDQRRITRFHYLLLVSMGVQLLLASDVAVVGANRPSRRTVLQGRPESVVGRRGSSIAVPRVRRLRHSHCPSRCAETRSSTTCFKSILCWVNGSEARNCFHNPL